MDATSKTRSPTIVNEFPIRVLEAAAYLGVSPQTVSLGRAKADSPSPRDGQNIRFLRSDLEPFRATFKQEVELARPSKHDGSIYPRKDGRILWMVYRDRSGKRIRESTNTDDWQEAQRKLRERLQARGGLILEVVRKGEQLRFADWVDLFLENYSRPAIGAEKTHHANERAALHLKAVFGRTSMGDITADDIERYLRQRLQTRVQVKTGAGAPPPSSLLAISDVKYIARQSTLGF